ncbi:hypothetical protein [Cupriavidus metallidurans]
MPDEIDIAQERAELHLSAAIAAARALPKTLPRPEFCLNDCGELPLPAALYCSDECRIDHQARKAIQKRQGS